MSTDCALLDKLISTLRSLHEEPQCHPLDPEGEWVEAQFHDQSSWRSLTAHLDQNTCQTALCCAGWVVELDPEVTWKVSPEEFVAAAQAELLAYRVVTSARVAWDGVTRAGDAYAHYRQCVDDYERASADRIHLDSQTHSVRRVGEGPSDTSAADWARARLGLTDLQADVLFSADNDYAIVMRVLTELQQSRCAAHG